MYILTLLSLIKTLLTILKRQIRTGMAENIEKFTDVLDDEILNSQPISLPSSSDTDMESYNFANIDNIYKASRPSKFTGQCGGLRSIEEIEPKYRSIFNHQYFNLVQSKVIEDALYSDKSMVVCAPTGSGKTVVFEMAIVQLLMEMDDKNTFEDFKIIYMAPIKALCTERLTEWYPKFTKLNHLCIEVTGDTDVDFSQLKPYRIIITTPEKWDMLTRRWRDNRAMVELIKLFLIDEVHILNEPTRGPVLEAVVSRMKAVQTSMQSAHRIEQLQRQMKSQGPSNEIATAAPKIRFVAVSATISNPEDVAEWLSTNTKPAVYHKFGDECRPVKLKRIVEGYPCPEGTSIFKFDITLNYKLWPIINKYNDGKPTLIFCNTRKSVLLTAEALSREVTINFSPEQRAKLVAVGANIKNKKVQSLVTCGVGCHHAGLLFEERTNIEQAFRNGDLPILITTTTLAMGVNLPAHLVIIKNTQQYVNGAYQEYSISTVLQMVGRAGRPQFDSEATAVIMTRIADKGRYQALVGGCEPLQSYLHKRLAENLNSEAALGTVNDVAQCVQWLRSTFLYVRASRDPRKYLGLTQAAPHLISQKIEELCMKAMNGLASSGLITMDEASCIESTETGRLMSIHYLDLETMKHISNIKGDETLEQLLRIVCESHELADMHLRMDERRCLNALNRNNAAATIRFPMRGKITNRQMKLNCIIQAVLGCLPILEPSLNQEALKVMRIAERICKCLVAYVTRPSQITGAPKMYQTVLNSIILGKCIRSHLWENSVYVSKQLKGIGPAFSTLLASAGKFNFMLLEESHPRDLERIMNKSPPAGNVLRKQVSLLPKYQITVIPNDANSIKIQLTLLNQMHLTENVEDLTAGVNHKCYIIIGDTENCLLLLTSFVDKDLLGIYNGQITLDIRRKHNFEHKVTAHCISSNFVGIDVQCEYQFNDLDGSYKSDHKTISPKDFTAKTKHVRQSTITDTFKIGKRKSYDANKTAVEKKRCQHSVIEEIEARNNSFDDKSLIDQTDFYKSLQKQKSDNVNQNEMKIDERANYQYIENFLELQGNDDSDKENFDEVSVDSILNNIEKEIYGQEKLKHDPKSEKTKPSKMRQNKIINRFNELNNKYRKDKKSNYSFLDRIDKKFNDTDEQCNISENQSTFSDSIKTRINTFLEKTKQRSNIVDSNLMNLLEMNESSIPNSTIEEETEKSNKLTEQNKNDATSTETIYNDNEQRYNIDSNLTNLVEIKKPGRINKITDNKTEKSNKITVQNENDDILTAIGRNYNEQPFNIGGNLMNVAENKELARINNKNNKTKKNNAENENNIILNPIRDNNIEPIIQDSSNKDQNKSPELDMSSNDIVQTETRILGNITTNDNITVVSDNDVILKKCNINIENTKNDDIATLDNHNDLKALELKELTSNKFINIQNNGYGDRVIQNSPNDINTNRSEDETISLNNIEQSYVSNNIKSIFRTYANITKIPNLRGNEMRCNMNQIKYTLDIPLTKSVFDSQPKEEYSATKKISTITSTSDKVEAIQANQYKNPIEPNNLTAEEIYQNKSNLTVQYTAPSYSNCLATSPTENNFPLSNNNAIENPTGVMENTFKNVIRSKSLLESGFLTVIESNPPNIYTELNTNTSTEINCTKTISFTKTEMNIYTKNTLEGKYCIMNQIKIGLDMAESNERVKDKDELLKDNKYEDLKYPKTNSIKSKCDNSNKSLISLPPSNIQINNSNINEDKKAIDKSGFVKVKDDSKQEDSRGQKKRTIYDILEKYKNDMSSKQKVCTQPDYKIEPRTINKSERIKRPFKITDLPSLHEPNIEFQNVQYGSQKPIYFLPETRKNKNNSSEVINKVNLNQNYNNIETDEYIQLQTEVTESKDTVDLSQSLFDPKTILECLNEDIIPPPTEFCDDKFSTDQDQTHVPSSSIANQITQPKNIHSFFEGKSVQSRQTETWTLLTNDDGYTDPRKSFNIVRNKNCMSVRSQMTRKAKLNEFKFSRKDTFKYKK